MKTTLIRAKGYGYCFRLLASGNPMQEWIGLMAWRAHLLSAAYICLAGMMVASRLMAADTTGHGIVTPLPPAIKPSPSRPSAPSRSGGMAATLPAITNASSGRASASVQTNSSVVHAIAPEGELILAGASPSNTISTPSDAKIDWMARLDNQQKLGFGDRVRYQVFEDQDPAKSITITDAGDIEVPYYGFIRAVDKTCQQLAREIKLLLEKNLYKRATVVITVELFNKTKESKSLGKVYIMGYVKTPGAVEIPANETLTISKAILKAGGFTDYANKKKVKLLRVPKTGQKEAKPTYINVADIIEKGKFDGDIPVEPEDFIFVTSKFLNF